MAFTESGATSSGNGTFLIEEIFDTEKGFARGPERALLSALLFDGLMAYIAYASTDRATARSRYKEAYTWVHTKGFDYVFSFDSVCEALGINPDSLRYGLANICNTDRIETWKRLRRNY
jgi:hypothetical protein